MSAPGYALTLCWGTWRRALFDARNGRQTGLTRHAQPQKGFRNTTSASKSGMPSRNPLPILAIPCPFSPGPRRGPGRSVQQRWAVHLASVSLAALICRALLLADASAWPHVGSTGRAHAGNIEHLNQTSRTPPLQPTNPPTLQDPKTPRPSKVARGGSTISKYACHGNHKQTGSCDLCSCNTWILNGPLWALWAVLAGQLCPSTGLEIAITR